MVFAAKTQVQSLPCHRLTENIKGLDGSQQGQRGGTGGAAQADGGGSCPTLRGGEGTLF